MLLAHQLAIASPWITADMVEAAEFMNLVTRYEISGVPRTVINEVIHIEGAAPEAMVLDQLMQVLDEETMGRLSEHWDAQ